MNSQDFEAHIQKKNHKDNVLEKQKHQKVNVNTSQSNQEINSEPSGSAKDVCDSKLVKSSNVSNNHDGLTISTPNHREVGNVDVKLHDVIKVQDIAQAIGAEFTDLCSRTKSRIQNETQILQCLKEHVRAFDSQLNVTSIGSTTYGFAGSNTNFNILVKSGLIISILFAIFEYNFKFFR